MKQTMKKGSVLTSIVLTSGLLAMTGNSYAAMTLDGEFTGNITATSTYLWRGQVQTAAALQGGVNYNDKSGLHGGLWTSNAGPGDELDIILGFSGKSAALSFDVGAIFYQYAGYVGSASNANFEEIYANVSQGQFSAQVSNSSDQGTYFEVAGTFPVKTWEMTAHFGHYSRDDKIGPDYADYNVSFKKALPDYSVSFMISDTDLNSDDVRTVVSVSKNFQP